MASEPTFAQLVSLACHDLRTPLATASGFAHTLQRLDSLEPPADRYVEMIGAASQQMGELLDLLGAVARIETGRFEPQLRAVDSYELAERAVAKVETGASLEGSGAEVNVDAPWTETALAALAECIRRHGGVDGVKLHVAGGTVSIGPVQPGVGAIALGEDLRDFAAAVATRVLVASGAAVELDGERLHVRLPS